MSDFVSNGFNSPEYRTSTGGPYDYLPGLGKIFDSRQDLSGEYQSGASFKLDDRKLLSAQNYIEVTKGHIQGLGNPYDKEDSSWYGKQEKFWATVNPVVKNLVEKGIIDPSGLSPTAAQIDIEQNKKRMELQEKVDEERRRMSRYPISSAVVGFAGDTSAYLDPETNPMVVPVMATEIAIAALSGGSSLLRTVGYEMIAALAGTAIEIPYRKNLADTYSEEYGFSEAFSDFLSNAVLAAVIPVGIHGIKKLPKSSLYKIARLKVRKASSLADELYVQARAAEFADSPFNLKNDLSFSQRISRTQDSLKEFYDAFNQNRTVGSASQSFSKEEIEEIISKDPRKLSDADRILHDDLKKSLDDGGDIPYSRDNIEKGFIDEVSDSGVTVRTADGEILKLDLNGKQLDNIVRSGVEAGAEVDYRRLNKSKPGTSENPELSGPDSTEVAELIDRSNPDLSEPLGRSVTEGFEDSGSYTGNKQSEIVPGGTVDSESFGVLPEGPELSIQKQIFEETNSDEYVTSLLNDVELIEKDFDAVLADGSVAPARDVINNLRAKNRKAGTFKFCGVDQ